jgi:DNA polymerase-4
MHTLRKIIHIDMDAFYASVEQRDNPELKGKPVIVGGNPKSRGVVAACSYEARKFGIHSAMAASWAYKLCPDAVFLRPRFDAYSVVSAQIRELFHEYTDFVEPLSLDEAYLDVTGNKKGITSATQIAQEIKKKIYERTGLTASAGVSFNKFLAKIASDFNKPDGLTVVTPEKADEFIDKLPIRKFFGIGKATEKRMHDIGIKTGADLKKMSRDELIHNFGKAGNYFYNIAHGNDERPVNAHRIRKSIGKETTLSKDINDKEEIISILEQIALKLENMVKEQNIKGKTVTLKIKYYDFQSITRSVTHEEPAVEATAIMKHIKALLDKTEAGRKKVRLLGITISNFTDNDYKNIKWIQLPLPF